MRPVIEGMAIGLALAVLLAVVLVMAQPLKPDPGPEEERVPAMRAVAPTTR